MNPKLIIQKIFSTLPLGESINHRLQIIRGSFKDRNIDHRLDELIDTLTQHGLVNFSKMTVLEIGTGWDAIGAILIYALGAKKIYTYDHVRHLRFIFAKKLACRLMLKAKQLSLASNLQEQEIRGRLDKIISSKNLNELLNRTNIIYKISATISQLNLKPKSLDLIFSNATLEHIPSTEICNIAQASQKILKPRAYALHVIGHGDHSTKNSYVKFLCYRENVWQFIGMNNIFYHNRLRAHEFVDVFTQAGGIIKTAKYKCRKEDLASLNSLKLDKRFTKMTRRQVAIYRSELLMKY